MRKVERRRALVDEGLAPVDDDGQPSPGIIPAQFYSGGVRPGHCGCQAEPEQQKEIPQSANELFRSNWAQPAIGLNQRNLL